MLIDRSWVVFLFNVWWMGKESLKLSSSLMKRYFWYKDWDNNTYLKTKRLKYIPAYKEHPCSKDEFQYCNTSIFCFLHQIELSCASNAENKLEEAIAQNPKVVNCYLCLIMCDNGKYWFRGGIKTIIAWALLKCYDIDLIISKTSKSCCIRHSALTTFTSAMEKSGERKKKWFLTMPGCELRLYVSESMFFILVQLHSEIFLQVVLTFVMKLRQLKNKRVSYIKCMLLWCLAFIVCTASFKAFIICSDWYFVLFDRWKNWHKTLEYNAWVHGRFRTATTGNED